MKLLFVTGLYPNECKSLYSKNCAIGYSIQNAPDTFQWSVIDGLCKNGVDFYVVSCPFLPCYPHYKKKEIKKQQVVYKNNPIGEVLPYSTLPVIKYLSMYNAIKCFVEKWVKDIGNEESVILTYTPELSFIIPIIEIKKKYPNVKLATIVTDLVDDMKNYQENLSWTKRIQTKIIQRITKSIYKKIDKFILLTRYMEEKIPESKNNNIVLEGICGKVNDITNNNKIPFSLLYTGVLEEYAGIKVLINAFVKTTDERFKLIICGSGPLGEYVNDMSLKDTRIEYRGLIPREEVLILQKSVTFLINPRQPNGGITKYSFPSKTMEYLVSGTPMIAYQLEGIPEEYYQYFYTPDDLSVDSLTGLITRCFTSDNLNYYETAILASKFIQSKKSAEYQVSRLLSYVLDKN